MTLNGKDAPFIAELLNHTDQTGPTAYIVSAIIPSGFFREIAGGKLVIVIDETTGIGDGYAIDFAKLLINYDDKVFTGKFTGTTEPGATVRLLGTSTTVTASSTGGFSFNAIPGINAVRASKNGITAICFSTISWTKTTCFTEGKGTADIDFSKFGVASGEENNSGDSSTPNPGGSGTDPQNDVSDPEKKECWLCHFCPQPLGLCIFIWLLIILVVVIIIVIIIVASKKKKKNEKK